MCYCFVDSMIIKKKRNKKILYILTVLCLQINEQLNIKKCFIQRAGREDSAQEEKRIRVFSHGGVRPEIEFALAEFRVFAASVRVRRVQEFSESDPNRLINLFCRSGSGPHSQYS